MCAYKSNKRVLSYSVRLLGNHFAADVLYLECYQVEKFDVTDFAHKQVRLCPQIFVCCVSVQSGFTPLESL